MTSQCPRCEGSRFTVRVPEELASHTASAALACCRHCLSVEPGDERAVDPDPPWETIHRRFPTGPQAVGLLLLIDRLGSLALNRAEIESLVAYLEANGVDLFLTLDRLVADPDVEPAVDLDRRRDQLEQLLD